MRRALLASLVLTLLMAAVANAATMKLFSKGSYQLVFDQHGKKAPNTKPQPGWGVLEYGIDYLGTQASHSATPVGWDGLFCVVVKWPYADCNGQVDYGVSVVGSILTHDNLSQNSAKPATFKITHGIGVFSHATSLTATPGKGHNEEYTIRGVTAP